MFTQAFRPTALSEVMNKLVWHIYQGLHTKHSWPWQFRQINAGKMKGVNDDKSTKPVLFLVQYCTCAFYSASWRRWLWGLQLQRLQMVLWSFSADLKSTVKQFWNYFGSPNRKLLLFFSTDGTHVYLLCSASATFTTYSMLHSNRLMQTMVSCLSTR